MSYAFNVATTLRALDPESKSRYITNDPMTVSYMKLNGYGLRNVTALLYDSVDKERCVGVTREDALMALVKGISDGFRGNNRNNGAP